MPTTNHTLHDSKLLTTNCPAIFIHSLKCYLYKCWIEKSPSLHFYNMADKTDALAQDTANLHLDEVTGERVSKSELKKRQKQRLLEEKKKEKAAAAPPKPEKKTEKKSNAELDESNLNPNVSLYQRRKCLF